MEKPIEVIEHIKAKLSLVPKLPGCYQMFDKNHQIIYVGKAKILFNRLKSYFTGSHDAKTTQMVSLVYDFEYIITRTEQEAFVLEHNFIKENRPHFNILLMDDKTYPYIIISKEENPRILITRDVKKIKKRGLDKYFGPYPNVSQARIIVDILNKAYPFRKCSQIPKKRCLYYDMKQCLGPCINEIKRSDYQKSIDEITSFLNGNTHEIIQKLKTNMETYSENLEFEKALETKQLIDSINQITEKQTITLTDGVSRDIFGFYVKNDMVAVQVLHMRNGRTVERTGEIFDLVDNLDDVITSYVYSFYDTLNNIVPSEILMPYVEGYEILSELLETKVIIPIKGKKKQLVEIVLNNAKNNLDNLEKLRLIKMSKTKEPLIELSKLINIPYPKVIELFDNSNIQGASPISAMVCYIDGIPSYKDYRKYNIKTIEKNKADDFHTMQEVLTRRYQRVINDNLRKPNLVIVDGGKPQVKAALEIFNKLNITDISLIGLEKDDRHRTSQIVTSCFQEIPIDKHSNLFLLLEAMQDEVHRFAVTFFKEKHSSNTFTSILDDIDGIGKKRKLTLLNNFSSIDEIKNASIDKLKSLGIPELTAKNILNKLNNN